MNCRHESFLKSSVGEEASSGEIEDKAVGAAPAVRDLGQVISFLSFPIWGLVKRGYMWAVSLSELKYLMSVIKPET